MVESKYEITKTMYNELVKDKKALDKCGKIVATNSCFKPKIYGYYGCRIEAEEDRYYLIWKHRKESNEKAAEE